MKNCSPKVSVIIPCYNQGQYLDEAVDSVINQTFKDFEIIIINDGSTDQFTIKKLKNYTKPKCCVIHSDNQGPSIARNIAIKRSTGEYILPLDADDRIGPNYLEEAVKILDNHNKIGIVYCDAELFGDGNGRWELPEYSLEKILMGNLIFCCALFRKNDYLETIGFNPNMIYGWEDWDFWLSLIERGKEVYKLPGIHFYYRIKNSGSREANLQMSLNEQKLLLKTIYLNHLDFYLEKMGHPIELYSKLNKILQSKDYKIGRRIVNPARKIKRSMKQFTSYLFKAKGA